MRSIAALLLLVGCSEYVIGAPDEETLPPTVVEERFFQEALPRLDVLFVVDGTGSMEEEQASFADAAEDFVDTLDDLGVAYQIGVTSTNPAADGALVGRPWIITGAAEDPAGALADALEVGTTSPPPSAGLYTALRALSDVQGLNRGFRRADTGLHVVFLSDGDDQSDDYLGADPVGAFLAALDAEALASGRLARASAIVGDTPDGCSGPSGTAQPGARYVEAAARTGGVSASICAADFAEVALALGDAAVEWSTVFPLRAAPAEGSVRVEVDGARISEGWSVDAAVPALVFDAAPAPDAAIHVVYTVAEGG